MKRFLIVGLVVLLAICGLSMTVSAAAEEGGGIIGGFLGVLRDLFIPDQDYFQMFREDIAGRFDAKFSNVSASIKYLNDRFTQLRAYRGLGDIFKVTFPQGSFLQGISVDFLSTAEPVLRFIRGCLTGIISLITAIICYRRVISLINR